MYIFKNGVLTELDETFEKIVQELKGKVILYIIKNHNIEWLSDDLEVQLYNIIFEFLEPYLLGSFLKKQEYEDENIPDENLDYF